MIRNIPPLLVPLDGATSGPPGHIPRLNGQGTVSLATREGALETATYLIRAIMEHNELSYQLSQVRARGLVVPTEMTELLWQSESLIATLWEMAGEVYTTNLMSSGDTPAWARQNGVGLDVYVLNAQPDPAAANVVTATTADVPEGTPAYDIHANLRTGQIQFGPFSTPSQWIVLGQGLQRAVAEGRARGKGLSRIATPTIDLTASEGHVDMKGLPAVLVYSLYVVTAAAAGYAVYRLIVDPAGVIRFAARSLARIGLVNECVRNALRSSDNAQVSSELGRCARQAVGGVAGALLNSWLLPATLVIGGAWYLLRNKDSRSSE